MPSPVIFLYKVGKGKCFEKQSLYGTVPRMGTLSIVATPIGNLEDITLRALRVLGEATYVLAEDTRVTKKLLSHYKIATKVVRLDAYKEREGTGRVISDLENGMDIALVSDAGTPTISDPGARLVHAARDAGIKVVAIPGASALTAALSIAGVATDSFSFLGFVPHKKGRITFIKDACSREETVVCFESTHRIKKFLEEVENIKPEQKIILGRELTKMFEEVLEGTAVELLAIFAAHPEKMKGEFVVIFSR